MRVSRLRTTKSLTAILMYGNAEPVKQPRDMDRQIDGRTSMSDLLKQQVSKNLF